MISVIVPVYNTEKTEKETLRIKKREERCASYIKACSGI